MHTPHGYGKRKDVGLLVFGEVLEGCTEAHLRHYRFCRCLSVACPEGEVGDVHVSTVVRRVSRAFFEAMRPARTKGGGDVGGPICAGAARREKC